MLASASTLGRPVAVSGSGLGCGSRFMLSSMLVIWLSTVVNSSAKRLASRFSAGPKRTSMARAVAVLAGSELLAIRRDTSMPNDATWRIHSARFDGAFSAPGGSGASERTITSGIFHSASTDSVNAS